MGRIIGIVPSIILLAAIFSYLSNLAGNFLLYLPEVMKSAASSVLHRELRLGQITHSPTFNQITISDVALSDGKTFADENGRVAVSAKAVVLHIDEPALMRDFGHAASYITSIDIDKPYAYIDHKTPSNFNFSDLFVIKPKPTDKPFLARINIDNGTVDYFDHTAPTSVQPALNRLADVCGDLDFAAPHMVTFDITAHSGQARFGATHAWGSIASVSAHTPTKYKIGSYFAHIDTSNADAAYLSRYFLASLAAKAFVVNSGKINGNVTISQISLVPGTRPDVSGSARVSGGTLTITAQNSKSHIRILNQPLDSVNGNVSFLNTAVAFNATANVDAIPITANGNLGASGSGYLGLQVASNAVNLSSLHKIIPAVPVLPTWLKPQSTAQVQASVIGPSLSPVVNVAFVVPSAQIQGIPVFNVRGGAQVTSTRVVIPSLTASMLGSANAINIAASFNPATGQISSALGTVHDLNIAALPFPTQLKKQLGDLSGSLNASIVTKINNTTVSKPLFLFQGNLANSRIHGLALSAVAVNGSSDGSSINLKGLTAIARDGGILIASGSAPLTSASKQPFKFKVNASAVNLASIGNIIGQNKLAGYASFNGAISGSSDSPVVFGNVRILDPTYQAFEFDQLRSNVRFANNELTFTKSTLSKLGVDVAFEGNVSGLNTHSPSILATASLPETQFASLDAAADDFFPDKTGKAESQIVQLADQSNGNISASAHISGLLSVPNVSLLADVKSAQVGQVKIADAHLVAVADQNRVTIKSLLATVDNSAFSTTGYVYLKSKKLDLTATASSTDLSSTPLATLALKPITGSATLTAAVTGTFDNPVANIKLSGRGLSYDATPCGDIASEATYDNNEVKLVAPFSSTIVGATLTLSKLIYNVKTNDIVANASVDHAQLARILLFAKREVPGLNDQLSRLPAGTDGDIVVQSLSVSGPVQHPEIGVAATASSLIVDGNPDDAMNVSLDIVANNGALLVKKFRASGSTIYVNASGDEIPKGAFNANIDASNIPLRLISPFEPIGTQIEGTVDDVSVVASGTSADPMINASVSASAIKIGKFEIDKIDSGRITLGKGKLQIAGVTLQKNGLEGDSTPIHRLTLEGEIPMTVSFANGVQASVLPNDPVKLNIDLPVQSADAIGLISSTPLPASITGDLEGHLAITGTFRHKLVNGNLSLSNYVVKPTGFATAFSGKQIAAIFNDQQGNITTGQITSSAGGYAVLTGNISTSAPVGEQTDLDSVAKALSSDVSIKLRVAATGFTVNEPRIVALYNAGFQGQIDGAADINGPVLTPAVTGLITISKAVGRLPAVVSTPALNPAPLVFNPNFAVQIVVKPGGEVRSPQVDALADGKFSIAGSLAMPNINGDLYLRKGSFRFPTATFKIQPTGTVKFVYNPPDQTTERINVTATTTISVPQSLLASNIGTIGAFYGPQAIGSGLRSSASYAGNGVTQRFAVTVTISGDLSSTNGLHFEYVTNPPGLPENVILASLGGEDALNSLASGNVQTALADEARTVFTGFALPTLLAPFESGVAEAFGLEDFSIDYQPGTTGLNLEKKIGRKLDIKYTRYITSHVGPGTVATSLTPLAYSVSLDYNFTNRFHLSLSTDDQNDQAVLLGDSFGF